MNQFNIREILSANKIVPVVTINALFEVDEIVKHLKSKNIGCIEVTLRTAVAMDALKMLKNKYAADLKIGVGTVVNAAQLKKVTEIGVDFIVSPGLPTYISEELNQAKIPFIPGVVTPSEIMQGMNLGYDTFKLFPAEIVGGIALLKTYQGLFPDVKFCPTGGINANNYQQYLDLPNVICVGGSWVL